MAFGQRRFFSLLLLMLWLSFRAGGQVDRAVITGTVTDQQGNRVPQCVVRANETATGFVRETSTTSQGSYELSGLPPGLYTVRFLKNGFAAFTADNVAQMVGRKRILNARLEVARGEEQTTITAPIVQLDRADAAIGAAIERRKSMLCQSTAETGRLSRLLLPAGSITAPAIKGRFDSPATDWTTTI